MTGELVIRPAATGDLDAVSRLAGALVRMHHAVDAHRFLLVDNVEEGYRWWFSRELERREAVILVAKLRSATVGYGYGSMEGRDWNLLLDTHGAVHDVFVAEEARGAGVGKALVMALVAALEGLGATVCGVAIYCWTLPVDLAPLQ